MTAAAAESGYAAPMTKPAAATGGGRRTAIRLGVFLIGALTAAAVGIAVGHDLKPEALEIVGTRAPQIMIAG